MIELETFYNFFNNFFHSNDGNFSISISRIFLGLISAFIFFDINCNKKYFSPKGYFPVDFRKSVGFFTSFFDFKSSKIEMHNLMFYVGLTSSILFTLGFLTQISCLLMFISLTSFINRNPFVFHSGTALLKLILFLMIFSKAGQELSLDKYLNIEGLLPSFIFFEKLIKIQIGVMYLKTFWYKFLNYSWRDGAAIHYVSKNLIYSNINVFKIFEKFFSNKLFCIACCYAVLLIELTIGISCFFSNFWFLILILGFTLHVSFIFFLRIKDFPYICLASLLIFIPSQLIENFINIILK